MPDSSSEKIMLFGGPMDGHECALSPRANDMLARDGSASKPTLYIRSGEWSAHFTEMAQQPRRIFIPKDFPGRPPAPAAA